MTKPVAYIVSLKFSPGLAKEFLLLGKNLQKRGWVVKYIISSGYSQLFDDSLKGVKYITKSISVGEVIGDVIRFPVHGLSEICQLFRQNRPKLLLLYNSHPLNVAIARIAKHSFQKGIRALYLHEPYVPDKTSYGVIKSWYIRFSEFFQNQVLVQANCALIPSEHSKNLFDMRYPDFHGQVRFAPILLPEKPEFFMVKRKFISLIGNLNQSRGPDDFFSLINYVAEIGEDLQFRLLTRSNIEESIQLLSPKAKQIIEIINKPLILDDEIAETVAESIAIFLPHKQAAQSGNIPVSFREGTPVIARDIPGLSQHIRHKENGYLFAFESSPEQILEAVNFVKKNFTELSREARYDFEKYFAEHNWNRYYQWLTG